MTGYNYIDLFHGIGGFALGAYWARMKFENHFCSDIEPYVQKLYKLRFPDSIQLGDITKIDTEELKQYGDKWIITGGFPCQDVSIAGKGAGVRGGARSGLWFEYWRLIRELRPEFAIMENVGALSFRGLDAVLGSLSEIGYNAEWQDIRASDMGAPHRRERVWILAYPECGGCRQNRGCGSMEGLRRKRQNGMCEIEKSSSGEILADSESERLERSWETWDAIEHKNGREKISMCHNKRNRNSNYWSTEPAVGRLVNGLPRRVDRIKGLGNAIVPQIAELLFNQIKGLLQEDNA